MELKVTTLEGKAAGSVQLSDEIFGLDPRADIIQRCVNWQLAKRQPAPQGQGSAESGAPASRCTSRRATAAPSRSARCADSAAAAVRSAGRALPRP